jgi:hypothetical protein
VLWKKFDFRKIFTLRSDHDNGGMVIRITFDCDSDTRPFRFNPHSTHSCAVRPSSVDCQNC